VVVREKKQRAAKPRLRSSLLPPANAVPGHLMFASAAPHLERRG
jgi:hypothetical protein